MNESYNYNIAVTAALTRSFGSSSLEVLWREALEASGLTAVYFDTYLRARPAPGADSANNQRIIAASAALLVVNFSPGFEPGQSKPVINPLTIDRMVEATAQAKPVFLDHPPEELVLNPNWEETYRDTMHKVLEAANIVVITPDSAVDSIRRTQGIGVVS